MRTGLSLAASARTSTMATLGRASRLSGAAFPLGQLHHALRRTTTTTRPTPTPAVLSGGPKQARRHIADDASPPPSKTLTSYAKPLRMPDAPPPPRPAILEVERKFAPTPLSTQLLASNSGAPPFSSLEALGQTEFEDVYYDTPEESLSLAGVWLRRRGGARWEAKVRVGGDYTNSAFEELTDVVQIADLLARMLPGAEFDGAGDDGGGGPRGAGLREVARLVSYRSKFLVDGRFTVILDATDFGHVVGEVELERMMVGSSGTEGGSSSSQGVGEARDDRTRAISEMDREIDNFMKNYLWAFPPGKPIGKLSAYFALKKQQ